MKKAGGTEGREERDEPHSAPPRTLRTHLLSPSICHVSPVASCCSLWQAQTHSAWNGWGGQGDDRRQGSRGSVEPRPASDVSAGPQRIRRRAKGWVGVFRATLPSIPCGRWSCEIQSPQGFTLTHFPYSYITFALHT